MLTRNKLVAAHPAQELELGDAPLVRQCGVVEHHQQVTGASAAHRVNSTDCSSQACSKAAAIGSRHTQAKNVSPHLANWRISCSFLSPVAGAWLCRSTARFCTGRHKTQTFRSALCLHSCSIHRKRSRLGAENGGSGSHPEVADGLPQAVLLLLRRPPPFHPQPDGLLEAIHDAAQLLYLGAAQRLAGLRRVQKVLNGGPDFLQHATAARRQPYCCCHAAKRTAEPRRGGRAKQAKTVKVL